MRYAIIFTVYTVLLNEWATSFCNDIHCYYTLRGKKGSEALGNSLNASHKGSEWHSSQIRRGVILLIFI